jgi:hypothetical protein
MIKARETGGSRSDMDDQLSPIPQLPFFRLFHGLFSCVGHMSWDLSPASQAKSLNTL